MNERKEGPLKIDNVDHQQTTPESVELSGESKTVQDYLTQKKHFDTRYKQIKDMPEGEEKRQAEDELYEEESTDSRRLFDWLNANDLKYTRGQVEEGRAFNVKLDTSHERGKLLQLGLVAQAKGVDLAEAIRLSKSWEEGLTEDEISSINSLIRSKKNEQKMSRAEIDNINHYISNLLTARDVIHNAYGGNSYDELVGKLTGKKEEDVISREKVDQIIERRKKAWQAALSSIDFII